MTLGVPSRIAIWGFVSTSMVLVAGILMPEPIKGRPTPVKISIQKMDGHEIAFQTILPTQFIGTLHGEIKGHIQECFAVMEPVGELKDGGTINNIVLHCGDATIAVNSVMFQD